MPPHRVRLRSLLLLAVAVAVACGEASLASPPGLPQLSPPSPPEVVSIDKDDKEPSSRIVVRLAPSTHSFSQYIAKVIDLSPESVRDAVRTFLASGSNAAVINIHNLHPGHKYRVMLVGRKENTSTPVKEQDVTMDPQAPDFHQRGSSIVAAETNITLKTTLLERGLQDSFTINYRQVDSDQSFPTLELPAIEGQKELELFLNRLNPGRDYEVSIVAVKDKTMSKPWTATVTTKPSKISSLTAVDSLPHCVNLTWSLSPSSGVDHFEVSFGPSGGEMKKESAASSTRSFAACDSLVPGSPATFSVTVVKTGVASTPVTVEHTLRPRPPKEINVRADTWSSKYRIWASLVEGGRVDGCALSVVSESLTRLDVVAKTNASDSTCEFLLPLKAGDRYELSLQTTSLSTKSSKVQRSLALAPAFDMASFGLSVAETRGGIEVSWPTSPTSIERVRELWSKIVGASSLLHARISPSSALSPSPSTDIRQFESSPESLRPIFISNLTMGACYKVQLYTVTKSGIVSESRFDEAIRVSPPPVDVSLHSVARTIATLRLSQLGSSTPSSLPDCQTLLNVTDEHGLAVLDRHLPLPSPVSDIPLDGLRPYHKYTATALVLCGSSSSSCPAASRAMRPLSFITRQDRPGPVQSPTVTAINSYSARLSWQPPSLPNGVVTHYVVAIQPELGEQWSVNVASPSSRGDSPVEAVVDGLKGGYSYSFLIRAVTEAGQGDPPAASEAPSLSMPIHAPPPPSAAPSVVEESIRPHSLLLLLPPSLFDSRNGPIIRFSILASEVNGEGIALDDFAPANASYTWSEVQSLEQWPTFTSVVVEAGAGKKIPTEIEIGSDPSCLSLPLHFVCNGPLKPSTAYRFRVRLFTSPSLHTDSPVSATAFTGAESGRATAWLLLGSIAVLFSLLLVVVCALLCSSSRNAKRPPPAYSSPSSKEGQWAALRMMMTERATECLARLGLDSTATIPNTNGVSSHPRSPLGKTANGALHPGSGPRRCGSLRERTGVDHRLDCGQPGLPLPLAVTVVPGVDTTRSRPVALNRFAEHVKIMSADSEFRFSEEYELLRNIGVGASSSAAESPANRAKNRFTNILPYDHSRVKLVARDDEEGEDYVNANFIPGAHSRREFIAAQGPLPSTRDDFWRMVVEQQCPVIVALTKCIEKGRDKCHQYWPDKDQMSLLYGDIEVTLLSETCTEEMVIRELRLTPLSNPAAERNITHMHYMAWPDFGVPESPKGIVRFARLFRQKLPRNTMNKAVVVHCSAGVGRSGTFMALDRLMYIASQHRPLDVFGTVCEMRLDRCHMVQNEQQYIFIHQALLFCLQNPSLLSSPSLDDPSLLLPPPPTAVSNHAYDDDEGIAESGL